MELLEPLAPLSWEPFVVAPIGDIQSGSEGTDWPALERHVDKCLRAGAWFLGTGDLTDFLSPSNRQRLRHADLYDTAGRIIQDGADAPREKLLSILKPTAGRWLGLHEGHHWFPYTDGTTTDTRLSTILHAPFAGTAAATRLQFKDNHKHSADCIIWSHHGEGRGLTRLKKVSAGFPQVDIFLQGHNTESLAEVVDTIEFYGAYKKLRMRNRTVAYVACGGFMRGYAHGSKDSAGKPTGLYPEKGMMRPTTIGGPLITITPRQHDDYCGIDIRVSIGD